MTERASPRLGTAPASLRAAVRRLAVYPAWVAFVAVAVPFLVGVAVPLSWQYAPLVASAVLFGTPHGAVDHLVPRRLSAASMRRSVAVVVVLYAVLGGAYLAWWFLHPVSAAVAFVLLTWAHWGQGDVYLLRAVDDDSLTYPRSVPHRLLTLVVRGAMPMAVPLVADATQYRRVVADFVAPFGGDVTAVAWLFDPGTTRALGVGLAALTLLTLLRGLVVRRSALATANATAGLDAAGGDRPGTVTPLVTLGPVALVADRGLRVDAAELGVLWLFFLVAPPVLAVGLYFCLWHALRHVVRLIAAEASGSEALRAGDHLAAFGRFARQAAPLTAVALAMVGGLYALVPVRPGEIGELVGLYLVLIAVLTLPHVVVVAWMDRVQGVWTG